MGDHIWYIFSHYCSFSRRDEIRAIATILVEKVRINENIKVKELRVIGDDGANYGVISLAEALRKAKEAELDLIEISPKARPPVAKIMDYGKFQYTQQKKQREIKAKSHTTETKTIQIKIGTGDHDLDLKSKRVSEWLAEGHRVKIDLFLRGRYKYMEFNFLKERLERFLELVTEDFRIADEIKKSPKGLSVTVERTGGGKKQDVKDQKPNKDENKQVIHPGTIPPTAGATGQEKRQ